MAKFFQTFSIVHLSRNNKCSKKDVVGNVDFRVSGLFPYEKILVSKKSYRFWSNKTVCRLFYSLFMRCGTFFNPAPVLLSFFSCPFENIQYSHVSIFEMTVTANCKNGNLVRNRFVAGLQNHKIQDPSVERPSGNHYDTWERETLLRNIKV